MNTIELVHLLQNLGLSQKEAEVYLALLELNEALPSAIAKKVGMKRPTCYVTLEKLQSRGLASSIKKKGVIYYQSTKPEYFLERERVRAKELENSLNSLSTALPELLALHKKYTATPQMSVYYGKEGLIQIMEDTLTTKGELLCWSNVEVAESTFLTIYHPSYVKKKVQRKIWSKCLFDRGTYAKFLKKQSKKQLREVRFIPESKYKFENEINIYDDKVSIISPKDQLGIIIQNQAIADSQRALFELAFANAERE